MKSTASICWCFCVWSTVKFGYYDRSTIKNKNSQY